MKTSFGQFGRTLPRLSELSSAERSIVSAFNQGAEAGRSDAPRRAPYMPEAEQEKFEAWLCGYDEVAPRYTMRRQA